MAVFTIFFCGTSSNRFDAFKDSRLKDKDVGDKPLLAGLPAPRVFPKGELVSRLAANHMGYEYADWIICDGPGSGNHQEAGKFVKPGNYRAINSTLRGKGWEENVAHAVAVLKGICRNNMGGKGTATLAPGDQRQRPLAAIRQFRKEAITSVNLIGWSRGGITCHMMANAMLEHATLATLTVNIFAIDPVPGWMQADKHRTKLGVNVKEYVGVFARDERSRGFSPVYATLHPSTRSYRIELPGRHATLVGNVSVDGAKKYGAHLSGPGDVTRQLAEDRLTEWGTPLRDRLMLSNAQLLSRYEQMMRNQPHYDAMKDVSYTMATQFRTRSIVGAGFFDLKYSKIADFAADPIFVNRHHRHVFWLEFRTLASYLFGPTVPTAPSLDARLASMYPLLSQRLRDNCPKYRQLAAPRRAA